MKQLKIPKQTKMQKANMLKVRALSMKRKLPFFWMFPDLENWRFIADEHYQTRLSTLLDNELEKTL